MNTLYPEPLEEAFTKILQNNSARLAAEIEWLQSVIDIRLLKDNSKKDFKQLITICPLPTGDSDSFYEQFISAYN